MGQFKIISVFIIFSITAFAGEHREHKAHAHGMAKLSMAFESNKGQIDFDIPAESVIGFEYKAKTAQDKKRQSDALKLFENKISQMIVFDDKLKCVFKKETLDVTSEVKNSHSDIEAVFNIVCDKSPLGSDVEFNFQAVFSRIKKVEIQVVIDSLQKSVEASKNKTKLLLK